MAGVNGSLGTPARTGMVTPLKWWFKNQPAGMPIPTPPPAPNAPGPVDEPASTPAGAQAAAADAATTPNTEQTHRGGSTLATRSALASEAGAGNVDNIGDFMKTVAMATSGPFSTAAFMGRLALSGLRKVGSGPLQIGGPPGADIPNSNSVPGVTKSMEDAAMAGVPRADVQKMGADALEKLRKKTPPAPAISSGKGGGGGASPGGGRLGSDAANAIHGR
jgi:hypothetical protein